MFLVHLFELVLGNLMVLHLDFVRIKDGNFAFVNEYFLLHKIDEPFAIKVWMHSTNLLFVLTFNVNFEPILQFLVEIPMSKVIDNSDVVDKVTILRYELMPSLRLSELVIFLRNFFHIRL